VIANVFFK
jgi:hypothetical protein